MAVIRDADEVVWDQVAAHRRRLVALVNDLADDEWRLPSLCEGWAIVDVVAHLTMPLLSTGQLARLVLRHPGPLNRVIRLGSVDLAGRYDRAELIDRLRQLVEVRRHFAGLGPREALIDAIGHGQDMAVPVGLRLDAPPEVAADAARQVLSYHGRGNAAVFRRVPLSGLRLVAEDADWVHGTGPTLSASMNDLFLVLIGRTVVLPALHGAGADELRRRVGADADRS